MSFTRVNPNGWPVNGTLTSAQLNALDIDHANAVDRNSAGDTVAGVLNFTGTTSWSASVVHAVNDTVQPVPATGLLYKCTTAGISGTTQPTWPTTTGATVTDGTAVWTALAAGTPAPNGSLIMSCPATITGSGSEIITSSGGRIVLGANDYPAYSAGRSFQRAMPFLVEPGASFLLWTVNNNESTNTATLGNVGNVNLSDFLTDGSVLTAIDIFFVASAAHSGLASPETMPSFTLYERGFNQSTPVAICSGRIPTPSNGTAWYDSGAVQQYTLIVPSFTIDNTTTSYYLQVTDESGATNARAGNVYQSLLVHFTASDLRPA